MVCRIQGYHVTETSRNVSAYVYSEAILRVQEYMQFRKFVLGQGVRVLYYGMYRSMRYMGSYVS